MKTPFLCINKNILYVDNKHFCIFYFIKLICFFKQLSNGLNFKIILLLLFFLFFIISANQIRYVEVTRTCKSQEPDRCYDTVYNNIPVTACACNSDYCNTGIQNVNMPVSTLLGILSTIVFWAQG